MIRIKISIPGIDHFFKIIIFSLKTFSIIFFILFISYYINNVWDNVTLGRILFFIIKYFVLLKSQMQLNLLQLVKLVLLLRQLSNQPLYRLRFQTQRYVNTYLGLLYETQKDKNVSKERKKQTLYLTEVNIQLPLLDNI